MEQQYLDHTKYAAKLQESLSEAYSIVCKQSAGKQERWAEIYSQKVHGKPHKVGAIVWLLNPHVACVKSKKRHCCWIGLYEVIKQILQSTYGVQHVNNKCKRLVVHFDRLKCHTDTPVQWWEY